MVSCSSSDPQSQLGEIDDLLKKGFPMTTEQTADVNKFVAEGKSLMEQGKDREASESFSKAINVLNMAQDAYIFNKAD
jgi:hypothetical protein